MPIEALAFLAATVAGLVLFVAVRHPRSEGSLWLASWPVLMASAVLIVVQPRAAQVVYVEHLVGPWFPALQTAGALQFARRPPAQWLVPTTLAVACARAALVAVGWRGLRYPLSLLYDCVLYGLAVRALYATRRTEPRWGDHAAWIGTAALAALNVVNYVHDAFGSGTSTPLWIAWFAIGVPVFWLQATLVSERAEEHALDHLRDARSQVARVLAGGVAHGFNNLLAVILGNAELALDRIARGRAPQATVPLIEVGGAVDRAALLTRRLLEHVGSVPRAIRVVDVRGVIDDVVVRSRASSGREIVWMPARALPAGRVDPALLETAITLLLENAIEAGGDAPIRVSLRDLTAREAVAGDGGTRADPGRFLAIEVTDAGAGIADDVRSRMFDPFFSTKALGRGLGLSAVAGIACALGGAIFLESGPACGTTASFWVPAAEGPHEPPPREARTAPGDSRD